MDSYGVFDITNHQMEANLKHSTSYIHIYTYIHDWELPLLTLHDITVLSGGVLNGDVSATGCATGVDPIL
jgi:hypothetical protein